MPFYEVVNPKYLPLTAVKERLRSALTLLCHFTDGVPVWTVPKSPSGELLKNGGLTPLRSAEPSPALRKRSLSHGAEVRNNTSISAVEYHLCLLSGSASFSFCLGPLEISDVGPRLKTTAQLI